MKAFVVAAGPLGVPVAEELVRACWSIETLFYDPTGPDFREYEKFQKRVSFAIRPAPASDWAGFWKGLKTADDAMLFLIGCREPDARQLGMKFAAIYSLQAGLLPRQAGPDAASWALARGEAETGVTLYRRGARPYCGDLLFQENCPVAAADDVASLEEKLRELAVEVVRQFWESSTRAQLRPRGTFVSHAVNGPWSDGQFAWRRDARALHDFVRASTHPRKGAWARLGGKKVTVWKTSLPANVIGRGTPGRALSTDPLRVWSAAGALQLDRVQPEGGDEMAGSDFARLRGISAKPGRNGRATAAERNARTARKG